ncbi:MAG: serine hydrolase domain-containing protein [Acidobacteriota bacterium]
MSQASAVLDEALEQGHLPSCSYIVARSGSVIEERARGHACVEPELVEADAATIYDLASLTKPLSSSILALLLHRNRHINVNDPVRRYLPAYEWEGRRDITILQLLTHTSGLPDWEPLYLFGEERKEMFRGLDRIGLRYRPGTDTVYSCLGYIQLSRIIEHATSSTVQTLFRDLVATPLGLTTCMFNPPVEFLPRIAATERGNVFERNKCGVRAANYPGFRQAIIRGQVHDHNAFTLGGASGNAGLFGAARDVHAIATELLKPERLLRGDEAALFIRNLGGEHEDHRTIGFQLQTARNSVAGPALSPRAVAMWGTTGTSVAIDPDRELIAVLLTNRVHPVYRDFNMNELRRRFHTAASADCVTQG